MCNMRSIWCTSPELLASTDLQALVQPSIDNLSLCLQFPVMPLSETIGCYCVTYVEQTKHLLYSPCILRGQFEENCVTDPRVL